MTGPEHYRRAEYLIASAWRKGGPDGDDYIRTDGQRDALLATAQVHATLALAAATAANDPDPDGCGQPARVAADWSDVILPARGADGDDR